MHALFYLKSCWNLATFHEGQVTIALVWMGKSQHNCRIVVSFLILFAVTPIKFINVGVTIIFIVPFNILISFPITVWHPKYCRFYFLLIRNILATFSEDILKDLILTPALINELTFEKGFLIPVIHAFMFKGFQKYLRIIPRA